MSGSNIEPQKMAVAKNKYYINMLKKGHAIEDINKMWTVEERGVYKKTERKEKKQRKLEGIEPKKPARLPERSEGRSASARLLQQEEVKVSPLGWKAFLQQHRGEVNNYASFAEYSKSMSALYKQNKPVQEAPQMLKKQPKPRQLKPKKAIDENEPSGFMLTDDGEIIEVPK